MTVDVGLCPDCNEIVDGHRYHPGCCPHDTVEDDEPGFGTITGWCAGCGSHVYLSPPDEPDDKAYWVAP